MKNQKSTKRLKALAWQHAEARLRAASHKGGFGCDAKWMRLAIRRDVLGEALTEQIDRLARPLWVRRVARSKK